MNKIKWIIFAAIAVGVLTLLVVFSSDKKLDVSNINGNAIQTANEQNGQIAEHVYGNPDSKVILINYGDFQCPACGSAHPAIKSTVEKYKDKIQFVFRNFPLTTIHANAKLAAATAEAAGLQGKYWEMHDKIYENQSAWSTLSETDRTGFFIDYAKSLGLDETKFKNDVASKSITNKINYDYALGKAAKVEGTPTFYLNGKKLEQSTYGDSTNLSAALDEAIAKNQ